MLKATLKAELEEEFEARKATFTAELRVELEACKGELRAAREQLSGEVKDASAAEAGHQEDKQPGTDCVHVSRRTPQMSSHLTPHLSPSSASVIPVTNNATSHMVEGARRASAARLSHVQSVPASEPRLSSSQRQIWGHVTETLEAGLQSTGLAGSALELAALELKTETQSIEERPLNPTVWDVAVLINTQVSPPSASIFPILLIGLAVFMQLGIIFALFDPDLSLTKIKYNEQDVEKLRDWRRTIAHDLAYYETATGESLTARVCSNDLSLQWSTSQLNANLELTAYLGEFEDGGSSSLGTLVCSLSTLLWVMSSMEEFDDIYTYVHALSRVPCRATFVSIQSGSAGIHSMSQSRRVVLALVVGLRVAVAALMLVAGALYLACARKKIRSRCDCAG